MRRAIVAVAVTLAAAPIALAVTHHVDLTGGEDYLTIQEGIDAASEGDTVLVYAGVCTGEGNRVLTFGYKNLVVMSEAGLGSTTIDCGGVDRAFYLYNTGQDTTTVIKGFWIKNGYTTNWDGGGLLFYSVGAIVEDCLISDCVASHNGGGLSIAYSTIPVKVRNCVFERNTATVRGGAMKVDHTSATIRRCLFRDNWTTDIGHDSFGGGAINLNLIDDSPNYACDVSRCTFVNNSSPGNGSAVYAGNSSANASLTQCIIAFNQGPTYGFYSDPVFVDLTISNLYGNEGGDYEGTFPTLVTGDPLFCDMAGGDFNLCANSSCLPANNMHFALIGFGDEGCAECDSAVKEASWGKIKALYR